MSNTREITVFSTQGQTLKKILTNAVTWGELKPLVRAEGFDLSNLLASENKNKTDLVNDAAVLPEGPFKVFLRAAKVKSGADKGPEYITKVLENLEESFMISEAFPKVEKHLKKMYKSLTEESASSNNNSKALDENSEEAQSLKEARELGLLD